MSDWLIGLTPYSDPLTGPVGPLLFRHWSPESKHCPSLGWLAYLVLPVVRGPREQCEPLGRGLCAVSVLKNQSPSRHRSCCQQGPLWQLPWFLWIAL